MVWLPTRPSPIAAPAAPPARARPPPMSAPAMRIAESRPASAAMRCPPVVRWCCVRWCRVRWCVERRAGGVEWGCSVLLDSGADSEIHHGEQGEDERLDGTDRHREEL